MSTEDGKKNGFAFRIPVELGQLMGNAGMSTGGLSGWWIALIVIVCLALIAGAFVFVCFVRRAYCFVGREFDLCSILYKLS